LHTVPPSSVEIVNQSSDSKLEIQENHELVIECLARNSKPASRIVWFRSNTEINPGEYARQRESPCSIRIWRNIVLIVKSLKQRFLNWAPQLFLMGSFRFTVKFQPFDICSLFKTTNIYISTRLRQLECDR